MICRVIFLWVNYDYYAGHLSGKLLTSVFRGALAFDTSAIVYINALYLLMVAFPLHLKETDLYYKITKGLFVTLNAIAMAANFMDMVYFPFTGRRTTASVFQEFGNEDNIIGIIFTELGRHWYLTLTWIVMVYLVFRLYRKTRLSQVRPISYYVFHTILLALIIPLCIFGMRGGIGKAVRPITISNANQYINRPIEAALVLNTPFSVIRTIGKKAFVTPDYFPSAALDSIYTPVHTPDSTTVFTPKNVVVFIIESFGREYIGALNKYQGLTPFTDSLISKSLTFEYSYCNGRKSIDGMPSVLSGIPMFIEPFFLTSASLNKVSSIAGELNDKGYRTAFFHGAQNGSMGFEAFSRAAGFKEYYGRNEYNEDPRYNGDEDFDGTWAIWDEEFFQFFCDKMSDFKEPFATALFSASSHHPFRVPERYAKRFPEGDLLIQKCIRYTDYSLQRFFEKASGQPWFKNTLFVITADHTNQTNHAEYQTDLGSFSVPVIFYAPGDTTMIGHRPGIAQQIDIMPTVLGYLGYNHPYISFGQNLLQTPTEKTFAVNYLNGVYQYVKGDYLIQLSNNQLMGVYRYKTDTLLEHNLKDSIQQPEMEQELKAIIQQYMERMNTDRLTIK